ncbi:hypothetical protein K470DRAFT_290290 [Piedraia hortae CBS 480.64]|uniref:Uncharacterized protein n=1 Tax=Piedraia hortae CBS 480.64 TaxID=1314780 RepID=A0A6A7BS32_9PEZI|nr:hypothetical protein K470DRAFT_290290 [Piedraia hortae CBS 480.64]
MACPDQHKRTPTVPRNSESVSQLYPPTRHQGGPILRTYRQGGFPLDDNGMGSPATSPHGSLRIGTSHQHPTTPLNMPFCKKKMRSPSTSTSLNGYQQMWCGCRTESMLLTLVAFLPSQADSIEMSSSCYDRPFQMDQLKQPRI